MHADDEITDNNKGQWNDKGVFPINDFVKNAVNMAENEGLVITEYELGTKPNAENFPKRNRIISGLSLGCIIIETGVAEYICGKIAGFVSSGRIFFFKKISRAEYLRKCFILAS